MQYLADVELGKTRFSSRLKIEEVLAFARIACSKEVPAQGRNWSLIHSCNGSLYIPFLVAQSNPDELRINIEPSSWRTVYSDGK